MARPTPADVVISSCGKRVEDYPIRLYAREMAEIFVLSLNAFYKQEAAGAFLWAENRPQIGKKSWSRARVAAYDAGDLKGLTPSRLKKVG